MKKLPWIAIGNDHVAKAGNFVFRLHKYRVGVYGMGTAYSLQSRTLESSKFEFLGYAFWIKQDGGYGTAKDDSVGGKIWENENDIFIEATKILDQLSFLED